MDSGRRFRGRGPGDGDGFYPGYDPTPGSSGSGSSGRANLPVWALVLIMVGSGLVTLIFLWMCVLFICRKRRARRAAVRDLEVQAAWESERDTARMLPPTSLEGMTKKDLDAKRCDQSADVELTFVVMAGEDQPSYLARPAANVDPGAVAAASPKPEDENLKSALESSPEPEKPEHKPVAASSPPPALAIATDQSTIAVENPANAENRPLKTPPSPS